MHMGTHKVKVVLVVLWELNKKYAYIRIPYYSLSVPVLVYSEYICTRKPEFLQYAHRYQCGCRAMFGVVRCFFDCTAGRDCAFFLYWRNEERYHFV